MKYIMNSERRGCIEVSTEVPEQLIQKEIIVNKYQSRVLFPKSGIPMLRSDKAWPPKKIHCESMVHMKVWLMSMDTNNT